MKRFANVLTLTMAALTLTVSMLAPAQANPGNGNGNGNGNNSHNYSSWCDYWEDCSYQCHIGSMQGKLFIDSCDLNGDCCYFEATCKLGNKSFHCEGYAKRGGFCYFKMEGSDTLCCLGKLSYDLKQMGGDCCNFDHCGYGSWYCQCYDDSGSHNN
jgi:hypothetical protein